MAIFVIGDVQGCYAELRTLLKKIRYTADRDRLWFVGDLVNRGPDSLAVLRFVRSLGEGAVTVLGNHDLHLLAAALDVRTPHPRDTLAEVLAAPDREALLDWLRHRPLLHHDPVSGFLMIHAGLPPQWDLDRARACAREVETVLASPDYSQFIRHMYGDEPARWSESLRGWERLRFITNCFTRLRYCRPDGTLVLEEKDAPAAQDAELLPWFRVPGRASAGLDIVCGHWSTLGRHREDGIWSLDSGCVWGGSLTALRLGEAPVWCSLPCPGAARPGEP